MTKLNTNKRAVTAKQAIELLNKHDYHVTEEEAEKILDWLYFYSELTVQQILKHDGFDTCIPVNAVDSQEQPPVKRKAKRRP
jgi:hypothetical protein